jgi:electron transfer flavoprotein-quinone oxidoreductase
LIPEGGYDAMPHLGMPGMLVCGDAASLTLAAGIWLEGVNFAMASGLAAARAITENPRKAVSLYQDRLAGDFVLKDHKRLRATPELIFSNFVQQTQPAVVCDVVEELFTVSNPTPKPRLNKIVRGALRKNKVRWRDVIRTTWQALRSYG